MFDEGYGLEKRDKHGKHLYKKRNLNAGKSLNETCSHIPVFGPFSDFLVAWDAFHFVIIMINLIQIPYLLAFGRLPYRDF